MRFRSENLAQPVREYERAFLDQKAKRGKLTEPIPSQYESLLGEIKERIRSAQLVALRQVNREMITLYDDIGRIIVARQEGDTWGKSVVANLARDLHAEFPGARGFSAANLWRMKLFHESYGVNEKLAPLVREISWSHNVVILEKCKDTTEREFYIRSAQRFINPTRKEPTKMSFRASISKEPPSLIGYPSVKRHHSHVRSAT